MARLGNANGTRKTAINVRRVFLVFSLGLNLGLLWGVVCLARVEFRREPRILARTRFPTRTIQSNSLPIHPSEPAAEPARFHWRQVESTDYQVYLANLRAIGCPELTIRDIILADLERAYAARMRAVPLRAPFWQTENQMREARQAQTQERWRLLEEKRRVVKALLNENWFGLISEDMTGIALAEWMIGTSAPGLTERVMALLKYYENRCDDIDRLSLGVETDADRALKRQMSERLTSDLQTLLPSEQVREFKARVLTIGEIKGMKMEAAQIAGLTPAEFRGLALRLSDVLGPFAKDVCSIDLTDEEEQQQDREVQRMSRELLGETRYAEFQRAADNDYRNLLEFTEKNQLSRQVGVQLYEARQVAQHEADVIREDSALSRDEQQKQLEKLAEESTLAAAMLLGQKTAEFLKTEGQWIQGLAKTNR
jgi:hypothetical protein